MSTLLAHLPFVTVAILVLIGLAGLFFKRNLIKILMMVTILEAAVNLFLVSLGYRQDSIAPIYTGAREATMAMPTMQALTLTAIVIGLAGTALMLSFAVLIYRNYKTTNVHLIRKLKG